MACNALWPGEASALFSQVLIKNLAAIKTQKYWLFEERVELLGRVILKTGSAASTRQLDAILKMVQLIRRT